jgi:hypothetical protein
MPIFYGITRKKGFSVSQSETNSTSEIIESEDSLINKRESEILDPQVYSSN